MDVKCAICCVCTWSVSTNPLACWRALEFLVLGFVVGSCGLVSFVFWVLVGVGAVFAPLVAGG